MKEIVFENLHTNQRKLTNELKIAYGMVQYTVIDISGVRCVTARLLPKDLTVSQKHYRQTVAEDFISEAKNDPSVMKRIITVDETSVYEYFISFEFKDFA